MGMPCSFGRSDADSIGFGGSHLESHSFVARTPNSFEAGDQSLDRSVRSSGTKARAIPSAGQLSSNSPFHRDEGSGTSDVRQWVRRSGSRMGFRPPTRLPVACQ